MPLKQPLKLKSPPATWAYYPIPENYRLSDSCVLPNTYGTTLSYTEEERTAAHGFWFSITKRKRITPGSAAL